jgi:parvulin-like peptidyl-prolyl isomerase
MVEKQLILDDFKAQGGAIPDSIIEDEIKGIIRKRYGDQATLTKSLQAQGKTKEGLRQEIREEFIVGYLRQKNIAQAVLISPAKIEDYYATNLAQYKLADQVKMRAIVLNCSAGSVEEVQERAQEILTKIDEGAPFPEMAGVYSEGSQARQQGDWGWVESSKKNGLSEIAFGLKPGDHSGVIGKAQVSSDSYWVYHYDKTGNLSSGRRYSGRDELVEEKRFAPGTASPVPPQEVYLIKADEKRPARTLSLEEVRDDIEKTLIALERNRLQKRWVERLKAKAFVRTY